MSDDKLIGHVSDTARWVAFYRAMETERPDAIFRDPFARRLAGAKGEAIVKGMPRGKQTAWAMIVRTAVMDEIIMRCITQEKADCVLNLAAGLDARPWRMPLPSALKWIDVDHPVMIDLKLGQLAGETPKCQYEGVRLDLADVHARAELFERIGAASQRVLVISEGLLIYLPALAVAELARDLARQKSFRWWLIDLAGPRLIKMMSRGWGKVVAAGNAPFQFAPEESTRFFAPMGWNELEWRVMIDESMRLKRTMPMAGFWQFIGKLSSKKKQEEFKRFSGIALLGRA